MLPWNSSATDTGQSNESDEMEALQTDVMRFMAILGFILMAIFALVQSLPTTSVQQPSLEERESLRQDIDRLRNHITEQLQTLSALRGQIQAALAVREELAQEARETIAELESSLRSSERMETQIFRYWQELQELQQQTQEQTRSLSSLRNQVELKRHELRRMQIGVAQLRTRAETARQLRDQALDEARVATRDETTSTRPATTSQEAEVRTRQAEEQSRQSSGQTAADGEPKTGTATSEVPERGLTLRFESRETFDHLLDQHRVQFYAIVDERIWQVRRSDGNIRISSAARAPEHYEMAAATVPREYVERLQRVVSVPGADAVTWAVVLPATTKRAIQMNIRGKMSGDIVIQRDGGVRLNDIR